MPRVSVITPVYNGARFLRQAMESVLNQSYEDWELLVIDDGSTDDSAASAEEYVRRFAPKVRLLRHADQKNHGFGATRNVGLANASGEFIALLDADDVWLPQRLELSIRAFDDHPEVGMVYGNVVCIDEHSHEITQPTGPYGQYGEMGKGVPNVPFDAYEGFVNFGYDGFPDFEWYAPVPTVTVRRHLLLESGGFATGLRIQGCEDRIMCALVARRAPLLFLPTRLALYRVHGASWSSRLSPTRLLDTHFETLRRVAARFQEMDPRTAEAVSQFIHYYWRLRHVPVHVRLMKIREVVRLLREYGLLSRVLPRYVARRIRRRIRRTVRF